MKKQSGTKLSLERETLMPLQADELLEVNGGTLSAIARSAIQVSKYACTTVTTVASHPTITCQK
ncbi:MAG: hypothetical protein H0V17_36280 [Deltaproteobacteria bacterium]|nr:hypothetical protein [Deltaproteobacteria bacterium]